ncbi:hypothetical protein NDU88_002923 [Pleurodeles waltl]|uniref:Uncharacterized protein n=1 Tax=Pleurodeles waltl TaxID=8319 RepID=A0AAV7Q842_PLEWA|nr:hypothetical protein NDU88_002923 [Pleurodeles waltl]
MSETAEGTEKNSSPAQPNSIHHCASHQLEESRRDPSRGPSGNRGTEEATTSQAARGAASQAARRAASQAARRGAGASKGQRRGMARGDNKQWGMQRVREGKGGREQEEKSIMTGVGLGPST